jgi:hypothetical protein
MEYNDKIMSLAEIEAELAKMSSGELRHLALKSWEAFLRKESNPNANSECSEEEPRLLAALDEAIYQADETPGQGLSGSDVRARLRAWTSK